MLPNLPEKSVRKAFVSALLPCGMQKELNALGVECVFPQPAKNIKSELRFHPDIVMCNVDEGVWYAEISADTAIFGGKSIIKVRQSYAKCSTIAITAEAFITSDAGIYKALKARGFDVLLVTNDRIELNGYGCGFIGGCTGKVGRTLLVFTGDIKKHAQYEDIKSFCRNYGVEIYSLGNNFLYDYGGILQIC